MYFKKSVEQEFCANFEEHISAVKNSILYRSREGYTESFCKCSERMAHKIMQYLVNEGFTVKTDYESQGDVFFTISW